MEGHQIHLQISIQGDNYAIDVGEYILKILI